jgi:hypothetical protein
MANTCCNACRACVQTNLLGLAVGAVAAAGVTVKRLLTKRRWRGPMRVRPMPERKSRFSLGCASVPRCTLSRYYS